MMNDITLQELAVTPLYIRMHDNDNVAIVVNDGGLPAGTEFPGEFILQDRGPQGHKIALCDLREGDAIVRYDVVIGYAVRDIAQGSWIEESLVRMAPARELHGLHASIVPGVRPGRRTQDELAQIGLVAADLEVDLSAVAIDPP